MSKVHFDEHSIKKYTLTIFLTFALMFCILVLMMQWHGDFKPAANHEAVIEHGSHTETSSEGK
jgi:hypothetical protein